MGSLLALCATFAAITGYTLRDLQLLGSDPELTLSLGNSQLNGADTCDIVVCIQHDDYPEVIVLPFSVGNGSRSTAHDIELLLRYSAGALLPWPSDRKSRMTGLGGLAKYALQRETHTIDDAASSAISIARLSASTSLIVGEPCVWSASAVKHVVTASITPDFIGITLSAEGFKRTDIVLRITGVPAVFDGTRLAYGSPHMTSTRWPVIGVLPQLHLGVVDRDTFRIDDGLHCRTWLIRKGR